MRRCCLFLFLFLSAGLCAQTGHSVARQWNELYLLAIRNDFARPVVHARNLYHSSAAMYDAWALVNRRGIPVLIRDTTGLPTYPDASLASETAVSYAAYRLLLYRYDKAPGLGKIRTAADQLMTQLGLDRAYVSTDYTNGNPAAFGNYIAAAIIAYGQEDGANELGDYANAGYPDPVNPPLFLDRPFSILRLEDPNHWQPLAFPGVVVDQSGNPIGNIPGFLGASWGRVKPFALPPSALTMPTRTNPIYGDSPVYHDPGPPPQYDLTDTAQLNLYRWNFEMVLKWSSHLDPADGVVWNISPGARGNGPADLPKTPEEYRAFYNEHEGGQPGSGHPVNPATGMPYADNFVLRGDYTRVLAEFWADGPSSETPPGHWFAIFNYVMDHPRFIRRLWGEGEVLPALEYDIKAYLTLGGAMHDAAITAWSIKGKYDYIRPISAIRFLASQGQASVKGHRFYDPGGIRLDPGYIELVESAQEVVNNTALMTVKARAWIGNSFIDNADVESAGVDWINPSVWEPYQRPNFVTPNFAGYVSGHSTFSSTAATVLTALTGSPYFPGGVGEFVARKNEFLVFEEGPTEDVVLQWATYQDAAAETSLSRIWGGIHPPADDIPGRRIGRVVGRDAYERADKLFRGDATPTTDYPDGYRDLMVVYPNPAPGGSRFTVEVSGTDNPSDGVLDLYNSLGQRISSTTLTASRGSVSTESLAPGVYLLRLRGGRQAAVKIQVF
ncbi:DUF6851 domain-containing protein [Neolewinella litorea]|uniref:T9SS type A sorting domain-containing protein n=1 Tax=Neolewinella litorea TaxID=2562452 RepID=A0A4S4NMX9_9BACT|nr:T9SS type A sorting domain-containing protein [Neolewinella litorea]THH39728.1 T9SS type A sorting domain-containing protein [Neolewinella litorea]